MESTSQRWGSQTGRLAAGGRAPARKPQLQPKPQQSATGTESLASLGCPPEAVDVKTTRAVQLEGIHFHLFACPSTGPRAHIDGEDAPAARGQRARPAACAAHWSPLRPGARILP